MQPTWLALRSFALVLLTLLSVSVLPGSPAGAAAIRVTTRTDEAGTGPRCSLREAVLAANGNTAVGGCPAGSASTPDIIVLPAGTYTLTRVGTNEDAAVDGDLDVTESATIRGAGDDVTVVNGNGGVVGERVFEVLSPAAVTISGVTVRNGRVQSGAGIFNSSGSVTLVDSTVTDNVGGNGAGVGNLSGTLTLIGSTVSGNRTPFAGGGGIFNGGGGTLSATNSVVSGNLAAIGLGGGIDTVGGSATLVETTVSGNDAASNLGGGIFNSQNGTLTIVRSAITGNHAGTSGGGILHNNGNLTLSKSTVTGNTSEAEGGGIGNGSTATIVNSTISGNRAKSSGGGIQSIGGQAVDISNSTVSANVADSDGNGTGDGGGLFRTAGAVVLVNTVVAGNHDLGGEAPDCSGSIATQGFNLVGANTSCIASPGPGDKLGTLVSPIDARLAPLSDNGGGTATHALLPGSPAIGAGSPLDPGSGGAACAATDQRGVPRSDCEIGAYELVRCFGRPVTVVGTSSQETFRGSAADEVFLALGGNDLIEAGGGSDRACGGKGNDRIEGGGEGDRLSGQEGNDALDGGRGDDLCVGGPGTDSAVRCERKQGL